MKCDDCGREAAWRVTYERGDKDKSVSVTLYLCSTCLDESLSFIEKNKVALRNLEVQPLE